MTEEKHPPPSPHLTEIFLLFAGRNLTNPEEDLKTFNTVPVLQPESGFIKVESLQTPLAADSQR
jgi:hypothetical protein